VRRVAVRFRRRRVSSERLDSYRKLSPEQRRESVNTACRDVLERNWIASAGYTMPNGRKYPWMWLWDSCFHAIAWGRLGDPRGVTELETLFSLQLPSGFVPHMGYLTKPEASLALWHVPGRSDITQPPMFGHALRELDARGFAVDHMYGAATGAINYFFEWRRDPASGLIRVVHPWETGWDDSPRWDAWRRGPFGALRWNVKKRDLVRSLELRDDVAWGNEAFDVGSAGFSALVAFNARELGELTADSSLLSRSGELARAIDEQWAGSRRTWRDICLAGPSDGSTVRTLDALLGVLVCESQDHVDRAFEEIFDRRSFWRPHGPSGTAADERSYAPGTYWRGDAWPQMLYLVMLAAQRRGRPDEADRLADRLVLGCVGSAYSERWNPETGAGLGAIPQGWAALATAGL
jgi:hypothetical protein